MRGFPNADPLAEVLLLQVAAQGQQRARGKPVSENGKRGAADRAPLPTQRLGRGCAPHPADAPAIPPLPSCTDRLVSTGQNKREMCFISLSFFWRFRAL